MPRLPALPSRVCPASGGGAEGGGGGLGFDGRGKEMEGGREGKRISTFPPPPPPRPSVSAAAAREASEALLVFGRWPPPFTLGGMPMSSTVVVALMSVRLLCIFADPLPSFHSHSLNSFLNETRCRYETVTKSTSSDPLLPSSSSYCHTRSLLSLHS